MQSIYLAQSLQRLAEMAALVLQESQEQAAQWRGTILPQLTQAPSPSAACQLRWFSALDERWHEIRTYHAVHEYTTTKTDAVPNTVAVVVGNKHNCLGSP